MTTRFLYGRALRAFTLIELMVVIAIIVIISGMVVPSVHSTLHSGRITQAANQITGAFSLAAEKASSENRAITIRLIANPDGEYRYLQMVEIGNDGITGKGLDRAIALPESVAMARNPALNSFFSLEEKSATPSDPHISNLGTNYRFREIRFRPGGRMSLNVTDKWFLTIFSLASATDSATPPANFATIQIDPVDSRISVFRP